MADDTFLVLPSLFAVSISVSCCPWIYSVPFCLFWSASASSHGSKLRSSHLLQRTPLLALMQYPSGYLDILTSHDTRFGEYWLCFHNSLHLHDFVNTTHIPHNLVLSKLRSPSLCVFSSQMLSPTDGFRCLSWFRLFFPLAASPALSPLKLICHLVLHSPVQWDPSEVPCHWCDIWPATQNSSVITCKPGYFTFCHIYMHLLWGLVSAFPHHVFNKALQLLAMQLWRCGQNKNQWRKQSSSRWVLPCRDFVPFSRK